MRRFDNVEEEKQKNQMNKVNKCDCTKRRKGNFREKKEEYENWEKNENEIYGLRRVLQGEIKIFFSGTTKGITTFYSFATINFNYIFYVNSVSFLCFRDEIEDKRGINDD